MLFILMRRNLIARSLRRVACPPWLNGVRKIGLERESATERGDPPKWFQDVPRRRRIRSNSPRVARRFSARAEAAGWPAGWQSALSSSPLFRDVPLRSRRPGPSRSLLLISSPSPPLLGVCPGSLSCCPTLLPCRGTRKRAPEASTAQRANLGARPRAPRVGEPRLASSRYTSPRLVSLRLACSRPRRASVSYIALAFVLIISNGATARERNTSIADARYYAWRNNSLSHVHALGCYKKEIGMNRMFVYMFYRI